MKFKKPKFWDFDKPNTLSKILFIFTIPIILSNFLLNLRHKKRFKNIKTICIGNIYLGGTGKTPSTIKLFGIFKKLNFRVAVAKKFYKSQLDEQILLKQKTNLILASTRKKIIEKAIQKNYDYLIFDDGLQDKGIAYDLNFVCFDNKKWIGNGHLIPAGPLREKLISLKKYDAVFLKNGRDEYVIKSIEKINPNIKIFFTYYEILNLQKFKTTNKYLIFSGIGNPEGFKSLLLNNNLNVVSEIIYPDHFDYNPKEIHKIKEKAKDLGAEIITTEKDFVKILEKDQKNINFLEIDLKISDEESLKKFIKFKLNY